MTQEAPIILQLHIEVCPDLQSLSNPRGGGRKVRGEGNRFRHLGHSVLRGMSISISTALL